MVVSIRSATVSQFCVRPTSKRWFWKSGRYQTAGRQLVTGPEIGRRGNGVTRLPATPTPAVRCGCAQWQPATTMGYRLVAHRLWCHISHPRLPSSSSNRQCADCYESTSQVPAKVWKGASNVAGPPGATLSG